MDGWIVGRVDALADRRTDGLVGNRRTDRRMEAQIDGWAKGGTDRWTDEQTDDHSNSKMYYRPDRRTHHVILIDLGIGGSTNGGAVSLFKQYGRANA